ncbi:MAG: PilZ domain-containing protein [Terracidiphilus sp.]
MTVQVIGEINASESSSGADRRLSRRFACDGFAEIYAFEAGFLFRGTIRDISQTGCYVMTKFALKLEILSEVDVLLILKNYEYRIRARVRNFRPGKGVGLEFLYDDPQVEARFQVLIQKFLDKAPPMLM